MDDYEKLLAEAAFEDISRGDFMGDERLLRDVSSAAGLLGFPVLLVLEARKRAGSSVSDGSRQRAMLGSKTALK